MHVRLSSITDGYSAAAMMYGLTLSLKNEIVAIAPRGRVNSVGPGWVYTPMAEEALKDPEVVYRSLATYAQSFGDPSCNSSLIRASIFHRTPMKKFAKPFDIATQIVVLSSATVSGHVTGQVIMVEGGMEGRLLNKQEHLA